MRIVPLSEKVEILVALAPVSQNTLAEQADLSSGQISKYKTGRSRDMTLENAKALTRAAGIPAYYLLADDPGSYIRVWLRELSGVQQYEFAALPWTGKVRKVWNHIQQMYPGCLTAEYVAEHLKTSVTSIISTLDGTSPLEASTLDEFLRLVGLTRADLINLSHTTDITEISDLVKWADQISRALRVSPRVIIETVTDHPELIIQHAKTKKPSLP